MKIAIIGSGIAGMTCAWKLAEQHQVTLFEANDYLGGHTATVDVALDGQTYAIDTGFIVYNDRTYPRFINLLDDLNLQGNKTQMSFSVHNQTSGLEYNGHTLATLFAQKRNVLNPRFWRLLWDILRFNRCCKRYLTRRPDNALTLGDLLAREHFNDYFARHYILPMGAAIWSASMADMRRFSLRLFLRFFNHHGLLDITHRPQWYVIPGGSREYIRRMQQQLNNRMTFLCRTPVTGVWRSPVAVRVLSARGSEFFDEVIFACHADQALSLLQDATPAERHILGGLPYQANEVVLHTDTRWLPLRRKAWASWNYWLDSDNREEEQTQACVTYNMNILQGLPPSTPHTFCLTLNPTRPIDAHKVLRRFTYHHPVFSTDSLLAQRRRREISGRHHTWYCGAYWYNGFHEDGVRSALDVVSTLNKRLTGNTEGA
ncbi:NAD(P)/FAD-dependent oxidoreductase [Dickeya lacustris]|uniref:FAD-dependent oxidoreductase n=1 Tax=Dickeya lacustris TaxID=2259638 RepID=A0ABY8G7V9_9GAMM|nr:FAD-dependent oxidoreductase [Dickeya lacustris]WFN56048.1 FAD-dependent oxidoreductase [Dickeya lacustris]